MFHPSADWTKEDFAKFALEKVRPLYDEGIAAGTTPREAYVNVTENFSLEPFHEDLYPPHPFHPRHADCDCKPGNLVLLFTVYYDAQDGDEYGLFKIYENEEDITGINVRAFNTPPQNGYKYAEMSAEEKIVPMPILQHIDEEADESLPNSYVLGRGKAGKSERQ